MNDNVLDSRDLQKRLDELLELKNNEEYDFSDDEKEELDELKSMANEVDEWEYGVQLIHEDYWVDYCKELCEDIGDIPKNLPVYIENNIDWDGVAHDLKVDYSEITYRGETYFYRNC